MPQVLKPLRGTWSRNTRKGKRQKDGGRNMENGKRMGASESEKESFHSLAPIRLPNLRVLRSLSLRLLIFLPLFKIRVHPCSSVVGLLRVPALCGFLLSVVFASVAPAADGCHRTGKP